MSSDFFADTYDAEFPGASPEERERARLNAEAMAGGPAPTPQVAPQSGAEADREMRVTSRLTGYPFNLGADTVAYWIEKHGPLAILSALESMDRRELNGKSIGAPVRYLEAILADAPKRRGGGDRHAEHGICNNREAYRREIIEDVQGRNERGEYPRIEHPQAYAEATLREMELAHEIAALGDEDTPERSALVREYQRLPEETP